MMRWMWNKKFIVGCIVGFILATTVSVSAVRIARPIRLTQPLDESQLSRLNDTLQDIWDITNGRYELNVVTTAPTSTTAKTGEAKVSVVAGVVKLHIFANSVWNSATLTP